MMYEDGEWLRSNLAIGHPELMLSYALKYILLHFLRQMMFFEQDEQE